MSAHPTARRGHRGPGVAGLASRRRVAELWRAAGIGFTFVWTVILVLVVGFWIRVTFYPRPGDELPGSLQVLLAPVAIVSAGLVVWTLACGWRLFTRRASGWDAIVVLGAFSIAVAVFVWAPGRFLDSLDSAPGSVVVGLVALGAVSVATGLAAQRAFRNAAVGLEPSDDEYLDDPEDDRQAAYADDGYADEGYRDDAYARDGYGDDGYRDDRYRDDGYAGPDAPTTAIPVDDDVPYDADPQDRQQLDPRHQPRYDPYAEEPGYDEPYPGEERTPDPRWARDPDRQDPDPRW